eukprot:2194212-Amphidinium_carterae.1
MRAQLKGSSYAVVPKGKPNWNTDPEVHQRHQGEKWRVMTLASHSPVAARPSALSLTSTLNYRNTGFVTALSKVTDPYHLVLFHKCSCESYQTYLSDNMSTFTNDSIFHHHDRK